MTRGNQRDKAREKAAKKGGGKKQADQAANAGLNLIERKQRDAERMRDKQKLAADKAAETSSAETSSAKK